MKAVGRFILVEELEGETESSGGVLLGKLDFSRFAKGKLISCSSEVAEEGDIVLYDAVNSHTVIIEGQKLRVIEDRNIAVIL